MNFIEKLTNQQIVDLIKEMKICRKENENKIPFTVQDNKIYVISGKTEHGEKIESIYSDFEILKLYNTTPSKYDQRRFQNFMIDALEKYNYLGALEDHLGITPNEHNR